MKMSNVCLADIVLLKNLKKVLKVKQHCSSYKQGNKTIAFLETEQATNFLCVCEELLFSVF